MVYIVGLGPGHRDYILPVAIKIMEESDVILGFKRALETLTFIDNKKEVRNSLEDILKYIKENQHKTIALVASGDPNFYGITDYINRNYKGDIEVIPGISSYQYLMGKLNKSWQQAYLSSVHGREEAFITKVKEYEKSIWLTDKERNPKVLCTLLVVSNINCEVAIGENLSYEDEKISIGDPKDLMNNEYSNLSVVFINKKTE